MWVEAGAGGDRCSAQRPFVELALGFMPRACEHLPGMTAGLWTREVPWEGYLLPCYWTLLMGGQEVLSKPEIATMSGMRLEKCPGGDGGAQKMPR